VRSGKVELAVRRMLRDAEQVHPAHEGLAAAAVVLAHSLDGLALGVTRGMATAAVARELRETLLALMDGGNGGGDDGFDALIARLSAPVGDTAQP
jgi:hypothetical protein